MKFLCMMTMLLSIANSSILTLDIQSTKKIIRQKEIWGQEWQSKGVMPSIIVINHCSKMIIEYSPAEGIGSKMYAIIFHALLRLLLCWRPCDAPLDFRFRFATSPAGLEGMRVLGFRRGVKELVRESRCPFLTPLIVEVPNASASLVTVLLLMRFSFCRLRRKAPTLVFLSRWTKRGWRPSDVVGRAGVDDGVSARSSTDSPCSSSNASSMWSKSPQSRVSFWSSLSSYDELLVGRTAFSFMKPELSKKASGLPVWYDPNSDGVSSTALIIMLAWLLRTGLYCSMLPFLRGEGELISWSLVGSEEYIKRSFPCSSNMTKGTSVLWYQVMTSGCPFLRWIRKPRHGGGGGELPRGVDASISGRFSLQSSSSVVSPPETSLRSAATHGC